METGSGMIAVVAFCEKHGITTKRIAKARRYFMNIFFIRCVIGHQDKKIPGEIINSPGIVI
jgi:hypothetical protein